MAVDMFLKLDAIVGESKDTKHGKEIDILAYSGGASNSGTFGSGGGGSAGKVNMQDFSITKYVDVSSPILMERCADGKHIANALLTIRKAGGDKALEYMKIKLTDLIVSSYSMGASGGEDRQTDNISFNFGAIHIDYFPQDEKGAAGPVSKGGWSVVKNAPA